MDKLEARLLKEIADLDGLPVGAYNIRKNGQSDGRVSTAHIVIDTKTDKSGIDIHIAPGTKKESVHIPVVITETFRQLHDERGATLVVISHQERIIDLADEIVLVSDGVIAQHGPKEEVFPQILANTVSGCSYMKEA